MRPLPRRLYAAAAAAAALPLGYVLTATPPGPAPALAATAPATTRAPVLASFAAAVHDHPAAPMTWRTRRGDTLASVSAATCRGRWWPRLWWANRHAVPNPALLHPRLVLTVPPCARPTARQARRALAAIPPPPRPPSPPTSPQTAGPVSPSAPAGPATAAAAPGSFEACVIARESGGNASAVNPASGAGGLYQFLPSTWAALGHSGLPQNASVAEQQQAFDQAYAASGTSPWSPSDGC